MSEAHLLQIPAVLSFWRACIHSAGRRFADGPPQVTATQQLEHAQRLLINLETLLMEQRAAGSYPHHAMQG